MKSAPSGEDPQRVLFAAEDSLPVTFDLAESAAGSCLVAVAHGHSLHLTLFPDAYARGESKTVNLLNDHDGAYRDVLLVVRFGAGESGELLCAAGEMGFVYLVSLAPLEQLHFWVFRQHLKTVMDLRFAPGQRLVTASQDHSVVLWDLRLRTVLCQWIDTAARLSAANQALPCPHSAAILAGYDDGAVRVLDAERAEVAFSATGVVDANVCAMEAAGRLLFVRSVTGRLAVAAVDLPARRLRVLKMFNLNAAAFSYFDALTVCRGRFLLAGCGENHWAAIALAGELPLAHRFVCAGLAKVKRAAAAEGAPLVVLCDERKVLFDYVKL